MSYNEIVKDEEITRRSKKELTMKLIKYLKPYKFKALIIIILMIFVMVSGIVNPWLLQVAIDNYIVNFNVKGLLIIGAALIILNLVAWVLSRIRWKMITSITNNILVNIRHELYTHIQSLSFDFFDSRPVGKILARVVGDVNALKSLFSQSIESLIPQLLNLICVAVIMLILNYKLALACIALLPLLGIAIFAIEIFSRKRWEIYRNKRSNLNGFTHEDFSGIKVVQGFANEEGTRNNFKGMVKELNDSFIKAVMLNDFFWPLVELSWGVGTIVVFGLGYKMVINNEITIGTLIAFSMYVGMFWRPIMNLSSFYNALITNFSAADRIFDILDQKPIVKNSQAAKSIGKINGTVEFRDVSFAYDNDNEVLKNINMDITPGGLVAIVGESGSGKSTIASLILNNHKVTKGEIDINDTNIEKISLDNIYGNIALVSTNSYIFNGTILDNLLMAKKDASEEEINNALKTARLYDFVKGLKDGLLTDVGQAGSALSGGQKQRLALARVILADRPMIIFDEATSNIDVESEESIWEAIYELSKDKTILVISHRLANVTEAKNIYVMNKGILVENGTHDELMKNESCYYEMVNKQNELEMIREVC